MNRDDREMEGQTSEVRNEVEEKNLRKVSSFCGCIDLRTGSYVIAVSTLIFGIIEVCTGFIGVRIAIEETMKIGISISCSILIAFAILLIFFSFILYVSIQLSDFLLMGMWIHFTRFFIALCFLFVILCVVFLVLEYYSSRRTQTWLFTTIAVFAAYGGFLIYGQLVVASYKQLEEERTRTLDELKQIMDKK